MRYLTLYHSSWSAGSIVLRRKKLREKNTEKEEDSRRVLQGRPRRARPMANGRPKVQVSPAAIKLARTRTPGPPQHCAARCILLFHSFLFSPLPSYHFLPPRMYIVYILYYYVHYNNRQGTHIIPYAYCVII